MTCALNNGYVMVYDLNFDIVVWDMNAIVDSMYDIVDSTNAIVVWEFG